MPKNKEYTSSTNHMVVKKIVISKYLEDVDIVRMLDSPFFALMLDKSIDRGLEKHLVIYATQKGWGLQWPKST